MANSASEKKGSYPMRTWNSPIERFFRNNFPDFWNGHGPETVPSLNIREEQDNYRIDMAAPGLKKENITIDVDDELLTISYEQESETQEPANESNFAHREYNYSQFSRSVSLPSNADSDNINANYTDGVLQLNIPKRKDEQKDKKHKITIS